MTLLRRLGAVLAAGFGLLLPSPAFAESGEVTSSTLPPTQTLTVPTLTVPQLQVPVLGSDGSGSLTVPTITVPQLQVPSIAVPAISVPTLTVPAITVPQLQVPSLTVPPLVVPELPALTVPQPTEIATTATGSSPRRAPSRQNTVPAALPVVTPQVSGLVSPEMLLEMLRVQEAQTSVELVAPQEATTSDRLPIGTFAAFGGGVALVSFAMSLLRRRNGTARTSEEVEA
jgi:hypothetical protein